jgi:hypothetical protein
LEVDVGKNPAIVVTHGPLTLREYIHPYAQQEKVNVQDALYSYVDIELDFKRKYPQQAGDEFQNVDEVASRILLKHGPRF